MKTCHIALIAALCIAAAWMLDPTGWGVAVVAATAASVAMMLYALRKIISISYRKRLYDEPGGRHIHTTPVPRLGGVAFGPVICCTAIMGLALHDALWPSHHGEIPDCLAWVSALIFIHMSGTIDDMAGLRYPAKLAAQIIAALLVAASGFWINDLGGLFGLHEIQAAAGVPLTVLFIVCVINAFNLIDGMDGLAAGMCTIALVVYGVSCFVAGDHFFSLAAFASLGAVVPFAWWNVRGAGRRHHKLFMGDTGSQTLGLVVGVLAVGQIMNSGTVLAQEAFVLVLSPLVVPVFDAVHVAIFRVLRGHNPFHPDTTHIHHRVSGWGVAPRGAVGVILALSVGYVALNALLVRLVGTTLTLAADVAVWAAFNGALAATERKDGKTGFKRDKREITKRENTMSNKKVEHNLNY